MELLIGFLVIGVILLVCLGIAGAAEQKKNIAAERYEAQEIREKGLEPISVPLRLQHEEECFFGHPASLLKLKAPRGTAGYHGLRVSIPITKGVKYRAALFHYAIAPKEEWMQVDSGEFFVTNKRLIFRGEKASNSIYLAKALSLECYELGTVIARKENGPPFVVSGVPAIQVEAILELILEEKIQTSDE